MFAGNVVRTSKGTHHMNSSDQKINLKIPMDS